MIPLSADQAAVAMLSAVRSGDSSRMISSSSTDSRQVSSSDIFFALRGERFDAHDYLADVVALNPAAVVVERIPDGVETGEVAVIFVPDVLLSLQHLASYIRKETQLPTVGITGSNGKTSTKDFTRSVLSQKYAVNATIGNLNNHIGLPLSVLATRPEHNACVFEMGMNHPGEIAPLCEISRPDIGIITNVGTAHIEFMGSQEAIAHEKGALARSLNTEGTLILPADCAFADEIVKSTSATVVFVGGKDSRVYAENVVLSVDSASFDLFVDGNQAQVKLPVSGEHMVTNALLAAAAGAVLEMSVEDIAQGLNATELTSGRLRAFTSKGVTILDDTYNANAESVCAALQTLASTSQVKSIAVLGRMAELGEHALDAYARVGEMAAKLKITLLSVDDEAEAITQASTKLGGEAFHAVDVTSAGLWLDEHVNSGDTVLFKGSRAAGMERVMNTSFPEN